MRLYIPHIKTYILKRRPRIKLRTFIYLGIFNWIFKNVILGIFGPG